MLIVLKTFCEFDSHFCITDLGISQVSHIQNYKTVWCAFCKAKILLEMDALSQSGSEVFHSTLGKSNILFCTVR